MSELKRDVGVWGATMMGLGSIIGTGVFLSIGIAAGAAGPSVILAIAVAGLVATCNGLSSAQLAANHPVSGGTYEYGYRWLTPRLGFTAGWMFLCAKSASAATAALGLSGYALNVLGQPQSRWLVPLALIMIIIVSGLVLSGIRRSSRSNVAIVSLTLLALMVFVLAGIPSAWSAGTTHFIPFFEPVTESVSPAEGFLRSCALMFVAFTGYGRIATMAEEVHHPHRTIPLAVVITLAISVVLYCAVGLVAVASVGANAFAVAGIEQAAPLETIARQFHTPGVSVVVAVGAITAMLGVLLNLILGLSRVALAMGRRRDIPSYLAHVSERSAVPARATVLVSVLIMGLALIGDVKITWSFSAFAVLVYYAITNLAAIRLSEQERLYFRFIPYLGLLSCLFLAFWVEPIIWMIGLVLIGGGWFWHEVARRLHRSISE
jgi:basic amino acid/polyamine antiporter, APA family